MPLFAYVSGYFSKSKNKSKLKSGLLKLIETFVVFQIIYLAIYSHDSISITKLITPWWICWYLLSLILWKLISFYSTSFFNKNTVLIGSFLLAILVGFIPFVGYPLSLSRTFVYLPFFILGVYSTEDTIARIKKLPQYTSLLFLIGIFILFFFLNQDFTDIFKGVYSYYITNNDVLISFISRCLFIPLALIMSIAVINLSPNIILFSKLGKDTLLFYLYHGFGISAFKIMITYFNLPINIISLFIMSVFIVIGIYLFSKVKLSYFILNSFTKTKNYLINR